MKLGDFASLTDVHTAFLPTADWVPLTPQPPTTRP